MKNILYVCPYRENTGYGFASRENVKSIKEAGFNVYVDDKPFKKDIKDIPKEHVLKDKINIDKVIYHVPVEWLPRVYINGIENIVYTTFEASLFPEHWISILNQFADCVCVPSKYNKIALDKSGFKKDIFVIPHAFDEKKYNIDKELIINRIPDYVLKNNPYIFYNISQWSERKNIEALLKSYYTEFKTDENVLLILKTYINVKNCFRYISNKIQDIKKGLNFIKTPPVFIIPTQLEESELLSLHSLGDCYVSLHRSEGFGIPIVEAMLSGKDIITTYKTGESQYIDEFDNLYKVNSFETPVYRQHIIDDDIIVQDWSVQYNGNQTWEEVDIMDARRCMRTAFMTKIKRKYDLSFLSHKIIGKMFKDVIKG